MHGETMKKGIYTFSNLGSAIRIVTRLCASEPINRASIPGRGKRPFSSSKKA